jgi:outer membrane protein OmpA-like peptidoglycan-associated protein/uncharacterized protein YegP (UPF0339 family)
MSQLREYDDDYLRCRDYHTSTPDDDGFYRFEQEGKFYFAFIDHGIVVLRSEGYQSEKSRDNGIESVKKNMEDEENYKVIELPGGQYALSLLAQNGKEIGRSCAEDSADAVLSYLPSKRKEFAAEFLRLASVEAGSLPREDVAFDGNTHSSASSDKSKSQSDADDYMICREYQEQADVLTPDADGMIKFQHENNGEYYFAWVGKDGKVILRSEGYPTVSARDNGLKSVLNNRANKERYKVIEAHGAYFLTLRAGNHQEIGRSCGAESEAALWALLDGQLAISSDHDSSSVKTDENASSLVGENVVSEVITQDAVISEEVTESASNTETSSENAAIAAGLATTMAFNGDDGETSASGVEGLGVSESVKTTENKDSEKDGDHKVSGVQGLGVSESVKTTENKDSEKDGDHKVSGVQGQGVSESVKTTENKDSEKEGDHKVSGVEGHGVSESVKTTENKDSEKEGDHKVSGVEGLGVSESVKTTENKDSEKEGDHKVSGVQGQGVSESVKTTEYKAPEKEDDYLACAEYKGYNVSDKANNIAFFKHKNGQFYFVVYHKDGSVRLRSEGFRTAAERDQELRGVIKYIDDPKAYTTIEKAGYTMQVLKDRTGREVARSCPEKAGAVVETNIVEKAAPAVAAATTAAAAASTAAAAATTAAAAASTYQTEKTEAAYTSTSSDDTASGGFNWKWLLPLLLLLPLFILWKTCQNKEASTTATDVSLLDTTTTAVADTSIVSNDSVASSSSTASTAATPPSCDLNWILFDFDKADIRSDANAELQTMSRILKENPSYKGVLRAFTDAKGSDDYNQRLSNRRAENAKNALISMGIDASRLSATANSESDPIAENTDDDSGRKYNRRVELYIQDANGKDICKSIAPEVPSSLKK